MVHETQLIALISMGFVLALAFGFGAAKLRIPPIVGYLIAGIAVGPFTPGFVADSGLASQLAEIGVILLMFGVGLHFSIDTLMSVKHIALPGAVAQIAVATAIGAAIAYWWGWDLGAGLVLGLALSVASTVVLLRSLAQRNELDSENGRIAVGWLIVEDLAMVLALVFLPAIASTQAANQSGDLEHASLALNFAITVGKVALFIVLMLVGGRRFVPWVLAHIARTGSRELFTLAVLAIALGIAYASATLFDVSFALGAFFAGVVLSESDLSHQAAADSLPLQDAFAVLFFVSVGMLFDPSILSREPLAVLAILAVIIVGKSLAAFLIVVAFRYPVDMALTVSASLAQIGEFSFILAGLGVSLGLLPPEGRDLILAGALLSISLNSLVFATIRPAGNYIRGTPWLSWLDPQAKDRSPQPLPAHHQLKNHAVIVGYGRVGRLIGQALAAEKLPFVAVEKNHRLVENLREHGTVVIFGDAASAGVLEAARIDRAKLLIVASPDGFPVRRILELARQQNPGIDTVVRTHSDEELEYLKGQKVGRAVMAERELALGMTEYVLRSLGSGEATVRDSLQRIRAS